MQRLNILSNSRIMADIQGVQGLNLTRSGSCVSGLIAVKTISQCLYSLVRTTEPVLPSLKRVLLTLFYFY